MAEKVTTRRKRAEGSIPLNIDLPKSLRERLDRQLEKSGRSLTREVTWALEAWLAEQEKTAKGGQK